MSYPTAYLAMQTNCPSGDIFISKASSIGMLVVTFAVVFVLFVVDYAMLILKGFYNANS